MLLDVPQRFLRLDLALQGPRQPDDKQLTEGDANGHAPDRVEVALDNALYGWDAPFYVDLFGYFVYLQFLNLNMNSFRYA